MTRKILLDWAGADALQDAEMLARRGSVLSADYTPPILRGSILVNNRALRTGLKIFGESNIESFCPCYANKERGVICSHVIALALTIMRRQTDPERGSKAEEERRHAERMASFVAGDYIRRAGQTTPGAVRGAIRLALPPDWQVQPFATPVRLDVAIKTARGLFPAQRVPRDMPILLNKEDESLLFVLEDICGGPCDDTVSVSSRDFINVLDLCSSESLSVAGQGPIAVNKVKMTTRLRMDLVEASGELSIGAITDLPFLASGESPYYVVAGQRGWVFGGRNAWPLENVLPLPYHSVYREPIRIARADVIRFFKQEYPRIEKQGRLITQITPDLFTVQPAAPRFELTVRGSLASVSACLNACYGSIRLIACKPSSEEHFALPDPDDLMSYGVRNLPSEASALKMLATMGLRGEVGDALGSLVGRNEVLRFAGSCIPALHRLGWRIEVEGKLQPFLETAECVTPVVRVAPEADNGWFDVQLSFEDTRGATVSEAEVHRALRMGQSYVETSDGRTLLVDSDAIESMLSVFSDCESRAGAQAGHFMMRSEYTAFVHSSLQALDGVDAEIPPEWMAFAKRGNRQARLEPVPPPAHLCDVLRPYQAEGLNWLRFLETNGFSGILADEMGLGKTLQTLAWLQLERVNEKARRLPALIVCPTSIVENWIEETRRFAPGLQAVAMTGAERHSLWDTLPDRDVVVTSYSLLRRDLERYAEQSFSAAVLDEAQHIKNRSTQNARAAKRINAVNRLVLTGTPIENGVGDIWSIFDFLMPGYLGKADSFRNGYELPISRQGADGAQAQERLNRKMRPFILRRLKRDVARELPPKIERVAHCALSPDQAVVYRQILETSRRAIADLVGAKGFNRSRMEILKTLMRLRQVCCHLDLLKLSGLTAEQPSAKLDLFWELFDEALDSGHRVLVFSQFVRMLHILRAGFDARALPFCYLDGGTTDRQETVRRFNTQRDIPAFLISLKAGGTGLNLTGADMVIHFDPWWNPAVENQATDRAYRIGQHRTVYSVKLITQNTVEEKVVALQQRKQAVIDATLAGGDEAIGRSLTWSDVQELLSL